MEKIRLTLILGAAREGRWSEKVAFYVRDELSRREDVELTFVDVRDHLFGKTLPEWEDHEEAMVWKKIAEGSQCFVIVTPEYNRGYPGELKILLDAAYDQYYRKPVLLISASNGPWGGVRVSEHIRSVLLELGMIPLQNGVFFPFIEKAFDEKGLLIDQSYSKKISGKIDELIELSRALIPIQNRK